MVWKLTLSIAVLSAFCLSDELQSLSSSKRLPRSLEPDKYELRLRPTFEADQLIEGRMVLHFHCVENGTNTIVLNILDIEILTASLWEEADGPANEILEIPINFWDEDKESQIVTFYLEDDLDVDNFNYRFELTYNAKLNDDLAGFYRSNYTDEYGVKHTIATSQMQATDARRVFPCLDEPDFKAVFEVELVREENMTAFSNMPIKRTLPDEGHPGWVIDEFEQSPRFSTYLVALQITDFVRTPYNYGEGWQVGVISREEAANNGETDYAGEAGPRTLRFYEDFFNIPYPLPKLDLSAVPDFALGGMENWGLIICRERDLLFNPDISSASGKRRALDIVTHEIAHQWFGDLVTMEWWNDLWLNEGFATYMAYVAGEHIEPTWRLPEEVVPREMHVAMQMDAFESSHPISVPVEDPAEISSLFDDISYNKGASIIRMMDIFLTRETFRKGLTNYLKAFSYENANQDDLWDYLTEQAHEDGTLSIDRTVKEIMDTWTLQMGYPVITVGSDEDGLIEISQKRFLMGQPDDRESSDDHIYSWWIPMSYTSSQEKDFSDANARPSFWFPSTVKSMTLFVPYPEEDWLIFNIQQAGYYRVNYAESNWIKLRDQLQRDYSEIIPIQRAQILDDALNLARGGLLDYSIALDLTTYLSEEDDFFPVNAALTGLEYLDLMFQRVGGYGKLRPFMSNLVDHIYENINLEDFRGIDKDYPDYQTLNLNVTAIEKACYYGNDECVAQAKEMFRQFWSNYDEENPDDPENQVPADLKNVVYCTALQHGDEDEWNFLWRHYELTSNALEKDIVLKKLACAKDIWILDGYLSKLLDESSGIRTQDGGYVFEEVSKNPTGRGVAWDFMRNNWDELMRLYGEGFTLIARFPPAVANGFNTQSELDELIAFQKATEGNQGAAKAAIEQAIDTVSMNIHWMDQYSQYVLNILDTYSKEK